MATVAEHNQIMKCVLDGSKHLKHVMDSKQVAKVGFLENRYPATRLPVCGHCEKLAFWHTGGQAFCPACGTYTMKAITYSTYLASGYDVDPSCATSRKMFELEKKKRERFLPIYRGKDGKRE